MKATSVPGSDSQWCGLHAAEALVHAVERIVGEGCRSERATGAVIDRLTATIRKILEDSPHCTLAGCGHEELVAARRERCGELKGRAGPSD